MTITDLSNLLNAKCPKVYVSRSISHFKGCTIAIDGNNWMVKLMTIAHRKYIDKTDVGLEQLDRGTICKMWFSMVFESINTWLTYGITPIYVFDGICPKEKFEVQQERRDRKEKLREKIKTAREQIQELDTIHRNGPEMLEYKKLLMQDWSISKDETETLKNLLSAAGIPVITAKGEAEELCAYLCVEKKVNAVFSADLDTLVYGAPIVITEFLTPTYAGGKRIRQVMTVKLNAVLEGLELSFDSFVDLCILLGCDYNNGLYQVGGTRAYKLIKEYSLINKIPHITKLKTVGGKNRIVRYIDTSQVKGLPKTYKQVELNYDLNLLKYEICKSYFAKKNTDECCTTPVILILKNNLAEAKDMLESFDLIDQLTNLMKSFSIFEEISKEGKSIDLDSSSSEANEIDEADELTNDDIHEILTESDIKEAISVDLDKTKKKSKIKIVNNNSNTSASNAVSPACSSSSESTRKPTLNVKILLKK